MQSNNIVCGSDFAHAAAAYLKLPANTLLNMQVNSGRDDVFSLDVSIALTADDLAGIADRMYGRTLPPAASEVVVGLTFSAWIRDRNEVAHRAMMDHARRGGQRYGDQG